MLISSDRAFVPQHCLGLWDKTPTTWHKGKVSLRAERSNLYPQTEIASSLTAPRNDNLVSSAPLFIQSFVSRSLRTKPSTPGHHLHVHPKVTVVIPTFNRAHYLAEAIQSVLNQTVADYELIVVDDGSTDETSAVLAGFKDPRLCVFRQEHRGISAAMNAGLRAARGEYIARLDSDDVWFADLLEQETAVLDSHPDVGVVYARAQAMSANGTPREHYVGQGFRYATQTTCF